MLCSAHSLKHTAAAHSLRLRVSNCVCILPFLLYTFKRLTVHDVISINRIVMNVRICGLHVIRTLHFAHRQVRAQRAGTAEARSQSLLLGNGHGGCHRRKKTKREKTKKSLFAMYLSLSQKKALALAILII